MRWRLCLFAAVTVLLCMLDPLLESFPFPKGLEEERFPW